MKKRILETFKMIAIGLWNSPQTELLTAAVVVPGTIAGSLWLLQWLAPVLTVVGILAGLLYLGVAIAKLVASWCSESIREQ